MRVIANHVYSPLRFLLQVGDVHLVRDAVGVVDALHIPVLNHLFQTPHYGYAWQLQRVSDLTCANGRAHDGSQEDVNADSSIGQAVTVGRKLRSVPVGASSDLRLVLICRRPESAVVETRKLAAILVSDVVGYSRLAGSDEDRTLARLRALRSDLIDPTIAVHNGRIVKRTGDGGIVEFRSVVDAVRCAIEVQKRHGRAKCWPSA